MPKRPINHFKPVQQKQTTNNKSLLSYYIYFAKRAPTGDDDIWFGNTIEERHFVIENARNHPNITLDVEGFELHQNDIPEKILNSIDFWNFQDVVTKLVQVIFYILCNEILSGLQM